MKLSRRVIRLATKNLSDPPATGYSASGESKFSRSAAHGGPMPRMAGRIAPHRIAKGRELSLPEKILETRAGVAWLEAQLRIEESAVRRAKLTKNLEIKSGYLAKLRAQQ